ncbi:putative homogentisate 1,2-dioxygenase [Hypoxylon rubiginosum]|uniref:Homogentisate 1,2-dioxygenase n=1 Tax=Hypoxylon rubiginosum TaxID=110542 RepID=A0ACC0CJS8_9PEZI|nr:putative homogentisate 1,2-dioxygenase [Hypoxylon rubiginosum]
MGSILFYEPATEHQDPSFGATAANPFTTTPRPDDPYRYQIGFGNRFYSEAVPDSLPESGRNIPQRCPYDLYPEQFNGTSFVSSQKTIQHVWFYRIRPSVAHQPMKEMPHERQNHDLIAFFDSTKSVKFTPLSYEWGPLNPPSADNKVTFIQGLKTISGHGNPTAKEGLAMHQYSANASMVNQAFVNNDGNFLIIPQKGRLDIQTESGRIMVRPGELFVVQAGLRFSVHLPDGESNGYVQEIFGGHYELPDLGPLGSNCLAHPRDFEFPIASFDIDTSQWEIIIKLGGELYCYEQSHTPFDVVSWHGNYVPYKYEINKLVTLVCSTKEQLDPSAYCILTAKSKIPGVSLTDFCAFTPKWLTATNAIRPPYYHRTMATEMMGLIFGTYGGSAKILEAGGLTCDSSYVAHGESYDAWKKMTTEVQEPVFAGEGTISFMFHMSSHLGVTQFAMNRHPNPHPPRIGFWDNLQGDFMNHIDTVNKKLEAAGRPPLGKGNN